MQTRFIAGAALSLLCLAGLSYGQCCAAKADDKTPDGQQAKPAGVKIGDDAPDFELTDAAGKTHKLSTHKDKIVVLVWTNQQCPFSDGAVPVVKGLHKKYADKGVVWLGIDSTAGRKAEDVAAYAKTKELTLPILLDPEGKVGRAYGAKTTPHVFVINKGKLAYMGALHAQEKTDAGQRQYVDEALAALLAGKPVPLAETTPWGCGVKYKAQ